MYIIYTHLIHCNFEVLHPGHTDIPLGITAKQSYADAKVVPFLALPYLHRLHSTEWKDG